MVFKVVINSAVIVVDIYGQLVYLDPSESVAGTSTYLILRSKRTLVYYEQKYLFIVEMAISADCGNSSDI